MATRSTIAMEYPNGTVAQIYCHFDGYLDNNGSILNNHYRNPAKIAQLIDLGDLSSLGAEIGRKRPFDCPHSYGTPKWEEFQEQWRDQCLAYGRDRGETDTKAREFATVKDFEDNAQWEQYNYAFRNGEWFVSDDDGRSWAKLARVLELLKEEETI